MPSTKSPKGKAAGKRTNLPRQSTIDKRFVKDWKRLHDAGRVSMADIKVVMGLLVDNAAALPPQYKDHALAGRWSGTRECHVHGDLLLIYRLLDQGDGVETAVFVALGTHADLFE